MTTGCWNPLSHNKGHARSRALSAPIRRLCLHQDPASLIFLCVKPSWHRAHLGPVPKVIQEFQQAHTSCHPALPTHNSPSVRAAAYISHESFLQHSYVYAPWDRAYWRQLSSYIRLWEPECLLNVLAKHIFHWTQRSLLDKVAHLLEDLSPNHGNLELQGFYPSLGPTPTEGLKGVQTWMEN